MQIGSNCFSIVFPAPYQSPLVGWGVRIHCCWWIHRQIDALAIMYQSSLWLRESQQARTRQDISDSQGLFIETSKLYLTSHRLGVSLIDQIKFRSDQTWGWSKNRDCWVAVSQRSLHLFLSPSHFVFRVTSRNVYILRLVPVYQLQDLYEYIHICHMFLLLWVKIVRIACVSINVLC